jgi:hypothetical protein
MHSHSTHTHARAHTHACETAFHRCICGCMHGGNRSHSGICVDGCACKKARPPRAKRTTSSDRSRAARPSEPRIRRLLDTPRSSAGFALTPPAVPHARLERMCGPGLKVRVISRREVGPPSRIPQCMRRSNVRLLMSGGKLLRCRRKGNSKVPLPRREHGGLLLRSCGRRSWLRQQRRRHPGALVDGTRRQLFRLLTSLARGEAETAKMSSVSSCVSFSPRAAEVWLVAPCHVFFAVQPRVCDERARDAENMQVLRRQ